jgi:hypothetical protein
MVALLDPSRINPSHEVTTTNPGEGRSPISIPRLLLRVNALLFGVVLVAAQAVLTFVTDPLHGRDASYTGFIMGSLVSMIVWLFCSVLGWLLGCAGEHRLRAYLRRLWWAQGVVVIMVALFTVWASHHSWELYYR